MSKLYHLITDLWAETCSNIIPSIKVHTGTLKCNKVLITVVLWQETRPRSSLVSGSLWFYFQWSPYNVQNTQTICLNILILSFNIYLLFNFSVPKISGNHIPVLHSRVHAPPTHILCETREVNKTGSLPQSHPNYTFTFHCILQLTSTVDSMSPRHCC
jgi:hypothetical protein